LMDFALSPSFSSLILCVSGFLGVYTLHEISFLATLGYSLLSISSIILCLHYLELLKDSNRIASLLLYNIAVPCILLSFIDSNDSNFFAFLNLGAIVPTHKTILDRIQFDHAFYYRPFLLLMLLLFGFLPLERLLLSRHFEGFLTTLLSLFLVLPNVGLWDAFFFEFLFGSLLAIVPPLVFGSEWINQNMFEQSFPLKSRNNGIWKRSFIFGSWSWTVRSHILHYCLAGSSILFGSCLYTKFTQK